MGYTPRTDTDARYVNVAGDTWTGPQIAAADPTVPLGVATRQFVLARQPDELVFRVGVIGDGTPGWPQWISGPYQTAWLAMGTGPGWAGSVDVTITGGYNYWPAMGRQTRRTDFYWDGAGLVQWYGDITVDSGIGYLNAAYGVGTPILEAPASIIWWPIYKVDASANDPISVQVSTMSPGETTTLEAMRPRFSLSATVESVDHGLRNWAFGATPWINATLTNGWQNYDGRVARYRRTGSGLVVTEGLVRNGSPGTSAFGLPPGFRPTAGTYEYIIAAAGGAASLNVYPDGGAVLNNIGASSVTSYAYVNTSFFPSG